MLLLRDGAESVAELSRYELEVASDGCGVIRSEPPGELPEMPVWAVKDEEGFQVVGRLAPGETPYRYHRAGNYGVTLRAHEGEKHTDVGTRY